METVLDTFPGLHFPVTRSTAGADGSCRLSNRLPGVSWNWRRCTPTASEAGGRPPECDFWRVQTLCGSRQNCSVVGSPPFLIPYSGNPVPLSHLHLVVVWKTPRILYLRRPICMALRNVTTRRRTIRPLGRKQGTLPWDISLTVSVCNRLFRYPIEGWPTSRSTFVARRLFCPLSE